MKTHELLIAIPTLNHPKLVMFYLSKTLDDALKYGIDICVFDASSDNKTEQIVQRRILEGYQNLYYKKYPENTLLEERCEDIYLHSKYKYVWLCGDGCVLNIRKSIDIVQQEINKNKDIICLGNDTIYVDGYKEYTSSVEFCKECFTATTYFGGVILNTKLLTKELFDYCKKRYLEQAVPAIYYELFQSGKVKATYIRQNFSEISVYKKHSVAKKSGRDIYAFAQLFTETIWKLPTIYNPIKKDLEKALGHTTGLYQWSNLWLMRVEGNLNWKIFLKYRKYLKIASDTKSWMYILICICPVKIAKKIALYEGNFLYQ
ncbi:MAG: hypothetical protein HFH74_08405 [Lachnospiraceae bacterium]|nr:hypothetical protein [Lachnospiraceae bacterium]